MIIAYSAAALLILAALALLIYNRYFRTWGFTPYHLVDQSEPDET